MNKKNYCTIYLVRHGETEWNKNGIVQGHSNNPLNKNGLNQAKKLAKKFKKIKLSAVFSSDLLRAKKTAEILAKPHHLKVITNHNLRERNFGPFEGKSEVYLDFWRKKVLGIAHEPTTPEEQEIIKELKNKPVETNQQMMKRFIPTLKKIGNNYLGKNVLVVAHGGIMRIFLIEIGFFKDEVESLTYRIRNTSYLKILFDKKNFIVKKSFGIVKNEKLLKKN